MTWLQSKSIHYSSKMFFFKDQSPSYKNQFLELQFPLQKVMLQFIKANYVNYHILFSSWFYILTLFHYTQKLSRPDIWLFADHAFPHPRKRILRIHKTHNDLLETIRPSIFLSILALGEY